MSTTADTQPANVPVYGLLLAGGRAPDRATSKYSAQAVVIDGWRFDSKLEGRRYEIPMRIVNYGVLKQHLDNMVALYGEFAPRR